MSWEPGHLISFPNNQSSNCSINPSINLFFIQDQQMRALSLHSTDQPIHLLLPPLPVQVNVDLDGVGVLFLSITRENLETREGDRRLLQLGKLVLIQSSSNSRHTSKTIWVDHATILLICHSIFSQRINYIFISQNSPGLSEISVRSETLGSSSTYDGI